MTAVPAKAEKQTVEEGLAWAAGTEQFQHRDPLYHVTESFQQTFDRIGQSHARMAAGGFSEEEQPGEESDRGGEAREEKKPAAGKAADAGKKQAGGGQRFWMGNAPAELTKFSDTAFQRGAMSASVINGTGKMMLVSCLKRTVGQSGPKRLQQHALLNTGSQLRNIPGRSPDQMLFHRNFAGSALGIVVDTLRDARRVVDSMADMAEGTGELEAESSGTLRTMYPFLDDSRDLALEAEYREKLAACTDEREKPILQNALVQTLALKAKKAQMKNEFISKLRFLSDRATETLAELEAPGVLDELVSALTGESESEAPENPEKGAEGDASNGSESGNGPADSAGSDPLGAETGP